MPTAARKDPVASFNFRVAFEGIEFAFSEISGLTTETTVIEYRNGNEEARMRKIPGQHKDTNIVAKRGMLLGTDETWKLRLSVINGKTQRFSGTITLLDEGRQPAMSWNFFEGFISKMDFPALNAKNNDVAVASIDIAVEGLELAG
jgi:phage tail-like protein